MKRKWIKRTWRTTYFCVTQDIMVYINKRLQDKPVLDIVSFWEVSISHKPSEFIYVLHFRSLKK